MLPRAPILIVEDDREMAAVLSQGFEQERLAPTVASDGAEGLSLALAGEFRAIVLDVMLPKMDGFTVARTLRQEGNRTPILLLTARDSVADIVYGLDCGAEDYVVKPFSFLELSARLRALIRRNLPENPRLQVGDLFLDTATHEVTRSGRPIQLTRTEFQLLEALMRQAGHVVGRRELLDVVWGTGTIVDDNNLDVMMSSLRKRMDKGHAHRLIRTVRGFGYSLQAPQV